MRSMSKEEEKSISAYVRLSFDNWYQGYKDHISKYLKDNKNHLYTILENVKEKNEGENVIKVNASHFIKNEELRECIDEALQFLEVREEYSIVFALPYENRKEADRIAYEITDDRIKRRSFCNEMLEQEYLIRIWSITALSCRYLIIGEDQSVNFAIFYRNQVVKRNSYKLEQKIFKELLRWVDEYYQRESIVNFMCGEDTINTERFQVRFNWERLGYSRDRMFIPNYAFEKLEGNDQLTTVLKLPESEEFIQEEGEECHNTF